MIKLTHTHTHKKPIFTCVGEFYCVLKPPYLLVPMVAMMCTFWCLVLSLFHMGKLRPEVHYMFGKTALGLYLFAALPGSY